MFLARMIVTLLVTSAADGRLSGEDLADKLRAAVQAKLKA